MKISDFSQTIQQFLPMKNQATKFSTSLPQIARNLNKVALPAIMLYAVCAAPQAEAGLLGFCVGYVSTTVVGGALVVVGAVTAPVGGGVLIAAGVTAVTAAPYVGVATGGLTGPV